MAQIPNDARVIIKAAQHWADGEWGIVKHFDGEYYHVATLEEMTICSLSRMVADRFASCPVKAWISEIATLNSPTPA
jgi:hypothetical protein